MDPTEPAAPRYLALARPPRPVTLRAKLRVVFTTWLYASMMLFGGCTFITSTTLPYTETITAYEMHGEMTRTDGLVVARSKTRRHEGGDGEDDGPKIPIWAVEYEFRHGGEVLAGVSYTPNPAVEVGDTAPVEYLTRDPKRSRLVGMRRRPDSAMPLDVPAVACAIFGVSAAIAVWRGLRRARLLRIGEVGWARGLWSFDWRVSVNGRRLRTYGFVFDAPPARPGGAVRPTKLFVTMGADDSVENEEHEPVFFDPERPRRAFPLDAYRIVVGPEWSADAKTPWALVVLTSISALLAIAGPVSLVVRLAGVSFW